MRRFAVLLLAAVVSGGCDAAVVTPSPQPTVTVTETVTLAPSEPAPSSTDPCAELVGGESLAFVFVTSPTPGTMVQSGFTFEGCANAFEANYQWRLLDGSGGVLVDGFGTATCGTGCVGTFQQQVPYTISSTQVGTLEVFTNSAEDGSVRDLNAIPIVLQP